MKKDRIQNLEHRTCLPDRQAQNTDNGTQAIDYKKQRLSPGSEKGFVLILSLMLLLVATVVGITALSTSTTNVMIAGNQRLKELNFAAADSGVSVSVPVINNTGFFGVVSTKYSGGSEPLVSDPSDFANEINAIECPDLTSTCADEDRLDFDCPVGSPDCASPAPDLNFSLTATNSYLDVDYLYAAPNAGSAIEFASGYDGLGKGAGAGGIGVYYELTSVGQGMVGSESVLCAVYRYVTK